MNEEPKMIVYLLNVIEKRFKDYNVIRCNTPSSMSFKINICNKSLKKTISLANLVQHINHVEEIMIAAPYTKAYWDVNISF